MKITSAAFQNGGNMAAKFSHEGGNRNPALKIEGTPPAAKGLVLMVDDPDAPGRLFTHWLVWNIDPKTTSVAERSLPKGAMEGTNDSATLVMADRNRLPARIVTTSKFLRWIKK